MSVTACRPAAELASFWNKPIVSWVATDPEFNDKTVYTTLGRTLGPFSKMGIFLLDVFKTVYTTLGRTLGPFSKMGIFLLDVFKLYNWRKVVFISSNYYIWREAAIAIRQVSTH